jgi:hypothetical protein
MIGDNDEGPADAAVAGGGAKFVLEPKEVVSTVPYRTVDIALHRTEQG